MNPAKILINRLELKPHKEGGYYRQTYQPPQTIITKHGTTRFLKTAIYYLIESNDFSCWHRLRSDEMWHFYCGSPITLYKIDPAGCFSQILLGNPLEFDQAQPQHLIPAETWFAACVNAHNSFTLAGCTVTPGFDYADFEIGTRHELLQLYPQDAQVIHQFTRETIKATI